MNENKFRGGVTKDKQKSKGVIEMVLGNIGPVSTPPKGGHESPAIPSGKIIIVAAAIVLLAGAMFAIFGGGGADVSSSSGSESNAPGSDGGSEGIIVDSDSSGEFVPTAEVTLSNSVVVAARGLDIVEVWTIDEDIKKYVPIEDMETETMYVYPESVNTGPYTMVRIATEKKKMDKISFSADGVSVNNIRPENTRGKITVFADMQIPKWKVLGAQLGGLSSKNNPVFSTNDLDLVADSIVDESSPIGMFIPEDKWKDTELVIIQFSVQNK